MTDAMRKTRRRANAHGPGALYLDEAIREPCPRHLPSELDLLAPLDLKLGQVRADQRARVRHC